MSVYYPYSRKSWHSYSPIVYQWIRLRGSSMS